MDEEAAFLTLYHLVRADVRSPEIIGKYRNGCKYIIAGAATRRCWARCAITPPFGSV